MSHLLPRFTEPVDDEQPVGRSIEDVLATLKGKKGKKFDPKRARGVPAVGSTLTDYGDGGDALNSHNRARSQGAFSSGR